VQPLAPEDALGDVTEELEQQALVDEPNAPAQKEQPEKPKKSLWALTRDFIIDKWLWLVAICVAIPLAVLGYLIAQDNRRARQRRARAKAGLKNNNTRTDGIVVAKVNGRTHHLGKLNQLPTIHIGSGVRNTIRIPDEGVSDRHIRLYRKGTDLMIQNIGAKPIAVNSLSLPPKAKQRLVLPAIVELTEKTKLHFSLLRPKDSAPAGKENKHEQAKQLQ
jgi:hypothetical protein